MSAFRILLITPPFTQLNTPYPGTAYLKGFFNTQAHIECEQMDLGIEVINRLFTKKQLSTLFDAVSKKRLVLDQNIQRIQALSEAYIDTIEPVIAFLQDKNPTLAHSICTGNYLPEANRFDQVADLEWAFGAMGIRDKARHLATLYLEDISDFIIATTDPYFGFSRYAERLARSASHFDELYESLQQAPTFIDEIALDILQEKLQRNTYNLVGFSAPFPGNVYSAFRGAQYIKQHFPTTAITLGGGYPNTELRSVTDKRVFEFIDYITLDDGEAPLLNLCEYLENKRPKELLKRTLALNEAGTVQYYNGSITPDFKQSQVGTPDYEGLPILNYLSVIEIANPMHRLWSDGRWNKLTLAHGCYWGKCTFCDISLDYIGNYEATSAAQIVDRIEILIEQTNQRGFHFVDEAAPPAMMRAVALEILKRKLTITWWTNIRFEKSFTPDLCRLLAASGCIGVSGGLEVASDRLLKLIDKGVTVAQVTNVADAFTNAGIMVHAYLMYGFPTQTDQETIDSLEVVRQLFEHNVLQSGFWHQFAMTAHSPIGKNPSAFKVQAVSDEIGTFANNDIPHLDPTGAEHDYYADGLKKSLFNYMHGLCFDYDLQDWFDFEIPETTIPGNYIEQILENYQTPQPKAHSKIVWIGGKLHSQTTFTKVKGKPMQQSVITIFTKVEQLQIKVSPQLGTWLQEILIKAHPSQEEALTFEQMKSSFMEKRLGDWNQFWNSSVMDDLKGIGLLVI